MEGGNKTELDLAAGLNVNTNDMLVPLSQNTWQHNWQKYQGNYLPNSLRYEKNGWAAGWNVYDFKYENLRVNITDNLWANNTQIRDSNVYMVSLFNAETSADVLKSYLYTQESQIVSVSNDVAIFDPEYDNIIHSTFGAISCNVTFDKDLKELTVDNSDVTITYVIQDNLDYKIQLVNNTNSFKFDCDFKTGVMLQCEQFLYDLPYSGFENGEHNWNDEFTFDGTNINGTVPCTVSDNTVTFDYDANNSFSIDLTLTLYDYIIKYTDLRLIGPGVDTNALIDIAAPFENVVNRITCDFSVTDMVPGDVTDVKLDLCVPVWLTVNFNYDLDLSEGAREPDNTYMNSIQFPGSFYRTKFKTKSIFENVEREGWLYELANYDLSALSASVLSTGIYDPKGYSTSKIKYRYNAIKLGNTIAWKNKNKLAYSTVSSDKIWLGEAERYPSLNIYANGQTLEIGSGTYDYAGVADYYYRNGYGSNYLSHIEEIGTGSWDSSNTQCGSSNTYAARASYWTGGLIAEVRLLYDRTFFEFELTDGMSPSHLTGQTVRQYVKYKNVGFSYKPSDILNSNVAVFNESLDMNPITYTFTFNSLCETSIDVSLISSVKPISYNDNPVNLTFEFDGESYGNSEAKYALSLAYDYSNKGIVKIDNSVRTIGVYSEDDPYYGIRDIYYRPIIWQKRNATETFPFEQTPDHDLPFYDGYCVEGDNNVRAYYRSNSGQFGYKLNTFVPITPCKEVNSNYYPFEEAPMFNYYGPVGAPVTTGGISVPLPGGDYYAGTYSANYNFEYVEGVYAVYILRDLTIPNEKDRYIYRVITDFDDYRSMLLGKPIQFPSDKQGVADVHYPVTINNDADRTRIVTTFPNTFYDYKRFNDNTPEEEKEAFRAMWKKWYPNVPNPQDDPPKLEDVFDPKFMNYNNIEIVDCPSIDYDTYSSLETEQQAQIPVYIKYTDPGVVLYNSAESSCVALSCFNTLGIVPWKAITTYADYHTEFIDMSDVDGKVNIWHNHENVNQLYNLTCNFADVTLDIKESNNTVVYSTLKLLVGVEETDTISLSSANFTVAKNQTDSKNYSSVLTKNADSNIAITSENENCWLNNLVLLNDVIESYNFSGGLQDDIVYQLDRTIISGQGLIVSVAFKGHIGYGIHYNHASSKQLLSRFNKSLTTGINYTDLLNDSPFTFYSLPDNELLEGKIYVDRDTVQFSHNWFTPIISDFMPLEKLTDSNNLYGKFKIDLLTSNDAELYYCMFQLASSIRQYPNIKLNDTERLIGGYMENVYNADIDDNIKELSLNINVVGLVDSLKVPVDLNIEISDTEHTKTRNHIFYKEGLRTLRTAHSQGVTTYDEMVANDSSLVSIPVYFEDSTEPVFTLSYDTDTSELSIPDASFNLVNATVTLNECVLNFEPAEDEQYYYDLTRQLVVSIVEHFTDIMGTFAKVLTSEYTLTGVNNAVYSIEYNGATFDYDLSLNKLLGSNTIVDYRYKNNTHHISFTYGDTQVIVARFNYLDNNNLILYYHGDRYELDVSQFTGNDIMSVESTDIRQCNKAKFLCDINATNEYQLVKQKWDSTIATENFWWVDNKHILELKNQEFTLSRNTLELDDWNGNRWENIHSIAKTNIVPSDKDYYTVLNCYEVDDPALFLVITQDTVNNRLVCKFYDIIHKFNLLGSINIAIRHVDLGHTLNSIQSSGDTVYLNTYSDIKYSQLLSQAKWTNTIRDGKIFIGCHLSSNFDQWTIIIDKDQLSVNSCIQGYGFVSVKGDLTGGQIPKEFFDKSIGFNDTVDTLDSLTKIDVSTDKTDIDSVYTVAVGHESEISTVDTRVVGTAERQWYICKTLTGVVSHLIYNASLHDYTVQYLPITNSFDAIYKSPSFMAEVLFDNTLITRALRDLCTLSSGSLGSIWNTFVSAAGNPDIYLYAPKFASIIYLQQTLGQYAYVHYNSSRAPERSDLENELDKQKALEQETIGNLTQNKAKEILLSDEITFDKQVINQKGVIPFSDVRQNLLFLFNVFLPSVRAAENKLSVNESINESTIDETASVFSQAVSENLASLVARTLHTDSPTTGLESSIVGVRSLDMFYSTSENQRVFAGPGFVEHQFVADCVAQSFTDTQLTCYIEQLSFIIKVLSTWRIKFANFATNIAIEALQKTADYLSTEVTSGGISILGIGGNITTSAIGIAAGIAAWALVKAAQLAARAASLAQEAIEEMVDKLANQMKADTTDTAIRQSVEAEGKHKYGEKNEYFMWPCWGTPDDGLNYTDEKVVACAKRIDWALNLTSSKVFDSARTTRIITDPKEFANKIDHSTVDYRDPALTSFKGELPMYVASCYGETLQRKLPVNMAKIEGVTEFLPKQAFKNKNIGVSEPVFTPSLFQDYIIDKHWELSQCVTYGLTQWVTCKDTKLINCAPSNMYITNDFCGIAAPYTAIEVKRGLSKDYMRPWAVTPNVLAFNSTGYNTLLNDKVYHAFDGMSYRIVDWTGSPGLNKNNQNFLYCFQINDRFKRSNKFPANEVQGSFDSEPVVDIDTIDKVFTLVTNAAKQKGLEGGTIGEDKDATRWALPIFTEPVNTMPAAVKTLTAMQLNVFDGITALTTNIMNNQAAYKAPVSVDFTIGKNTYRYTNDYICLVQTKEGVDIITEITPALGLTFIGASLTEAYFYSQATRFFYVFAGNTLMKMDMLERFRNIKKGAWDFVNHEVVMPCLMSYTRLDSTVKDTDTETDNIIVPVMSKDKVSGELPPPLTTIFNDRSWYKVVSLPAGLAYQGPNRVIINRNIFTEYMLKSIKNNLGKWERLDREQYSTKRNYNKAYSTVNKDIKSVDGWVYNPFVLVTSPLGLNEATDCLFEWTITFCWPIEMDLIYGVDNYAVVNIMSETMTPGGKVTARPTHVYLTKELFTRNGNYGYYSFTYQSKNGSGNRERLHIWSDQYIAISSITCESKVVTSNRTEILTQQVDVKDLIEL